MVKDSASLLIIIPAYNEADAYPALLSALEDFKGKNPLLKVRVVIVDDCSSDNTADVLEEACKTRDWLCYMQLAKRGGSHAAILAGLIQSDEDYAVFVAADLQDPLALIPEMIGKAQDGHDVVWAVRESQDEHASFEYWTSKIFYEMMKKFSSVGELPFQASFALLSRKAIAALKKNAGTHFSLIVEIPRIGFKVATIPFHKGARVSGTSKWTIRRKLMAFTDAMVSSSYLPLRAMSVIGFVISILGFIYAAFLVAFWFYNANATSGWTSLIVIMLIIGGLQMIMLGVIGEYLWRTNEYARGRSLFNINKSINIKATEE